jgi:Ankyrin repeats (3 copies)
LICSYLIEKKYVSLAKKELSLSRLCLEYLSMDCFESGLADRHIQEFITAGHYAFAEYAIVYWSEHLLSATRVVEARNLEPLAQLIEVFLKNHFYPTPSAQPVPKPIEKGIEMFQPYAFYNNLGQAIALLENRKLSTSKAETSINNLNFEDHLARVRSLVEKLSSSEKTRQSLERIHGAAMFKCCRIDCKSFYEGFSNLDDYRQHQKSHDRPFHCTFEGCLAAQGGFASLAKLQRHTQRLHDPSQIPGFPCYQEPDKSLVALAVREVNIPVIKRFLGIDAPSGVRSVSAWRCLEVWKTAVRHPDDEVLDILISLAKSQPGASRWGLSRPVHLYRQMIYFATKAGQIDLLRRLVEHEFRNGDTIGAIIGKPAMAVAVSRDNVDILRILMHKDLSKSKLGVEKGQYLLVEACRSGSFSCVEYFVSECGLDPFQHDYPHPHLRKRRRLNSNLAHLRKRKLGRALTDLRLRGPLYNAIAAGHKNIVERLLSFEGDDRFSKPEDTERLLEGAAANGLGDMVEMLANRSFGFDKLIAKHYTVKANLFNAVRSGKVELVSELLPIAGPDYDLPDHNGYSMLMYAALNGLEHAVAYLLQKGADVNRMGNCPEATANASWYQTALLLASVNGHVSVVRQLLQRADIKVRSDLITLETKCRFGRRNPIDVPLSRGQHTIFKLLKDHVARNQTAPSYPRVDSALESRALADHDPGKSSNESLHPAIAESGEDSTESESEEGSEEGF